MSEAFKASRWTRGNFLFPTIIEITDTSVIRYKRSWFTVNEMSIHLSRVASVRIQTGLAWSDILIESTGGSDPILSHGHTKDDARRIKELVEQGQTRFARAHDY
jgi:Bacterial PH domain